MSKIMEIEVASHYFKVKCLTPRASALCISFSKKFVLMGMIREPRARPRMGAIRVFAATNNSRDAFRFHINSFIQFKEFLIKNYVLEEYYTISNVPMYTPLKIKAPVKEGWVARDYQVPAIDYILHKKLPTHLLALQTGRGKMQPLYAKIKVPGGWSTMGEMYVGKDIIAKDGTITKVTGVFPQGKLQQYKITFSDGRSTECGAEHLWKVYKNGWGGDGYKVLNTIEIIKLMSLDQYKRLYVDLIDNEIMPDISLPIDPYALGVILGDGGCSASTITVTKNDMFIFDELSKILPESLKLNKVISKVPNKATSYRIVKSNNSSHNNDYISILKDLDIMGKKSLEKFIPEIYLNASYNQKLSILQGLLDTDGYCGLDGSIEYSSSSKQLAEDVQYLIRSLGGMAYMGSRILYYRHNGEKVICAINYRMKIRIKNPSRLFRLPRKKNRVNDNNQYSVNLKLRIETIEETTIEEAQCISIDHPDKLYITDDFIVTHNTSVALMGASKIGERVVCIMKPAYIEKWCGDILQILNVKASDVMTVSGGDQLRGLIDMALEGTLTSKFIIISNRTYQNYISKYEEVGNDLDLLGYGCTPDKFFEVLKAGVRLIDEVHQDAHLNFKIDLYSNVPRAISLSATLQSNDAFLNEMYDLLCHTSDRYREAFIDKYIDAYAVFYKFNEGAKLRSTEFGSTNYSHHAFEKSIIKDPKLLQLYLNLINDMVLVSYLNNYQKGDKLAIFASSIDMCTRITEYLKRTHRHLDVRRYVEDDPYENIIDADIRVTTIQSGGTAIDIPGLIATILTVAVNSIVSNKQTLGRLRKIVGRTVNFYYLVCQNIPKHIDYHYARKEMLLENARHFKEVFYKDVLV